MKNSSTGEKKELRTIGSKQYTDESFEVLRHSASHLLAHAVLELFPGTKTGIGPAVENGFYYDFFERRTVYP